jgi:uncharacterized membrane protein YgcG
VRNRVAVLLAVAMSLSMLPEALHGGLSVDDALLRFFLALFVARLGVGLVTKVADYYGSSGGSPQGGSSGAGPEKGGGGPP